MRRIIYSALTLFLLISAGALAQEKKLSPPASAEGEINGVTVEINYHQPSARGREMIGGKEPFGKVWRTGANNATTISFSEDVNVQGEELAAGKYSLFTIPGEKEWTFIFNSETDIWGTQYNEKADVLRVTAQADKTKEFVETFDISIDENDVVLSWENTMVKFQVSK